MSRLLLLVVALLSAAAFARPLTKAQKLEDFHTLVASIHTSYGPLEYKIANKGIDLALLDAQTENRILNTATNAEFYYELVKYIAAYQDGHFGMSVPSDVIYKLPVAADLVDGKVLITYIDREKLPVVSFPFDLGDEIVKVDGMDIKDYLDEQVLYSPSGTELSRRRGASWSVFYRSAARMPVPKTDTLKIEVRRGTSSVIEERELGWEKEGLFIDQAMPAPLLFTPMRVSRPVDDEYNFDMLKNNSLKGLINPEADYLFMCQGKTRIDIPADATVIMREPFVAYYHPAPKGNIGYLRIPHYAPQAGPGQNRTEVTLNWIAQYEYAIQKLEANTVGLIIDQDHNCGGSVWVVDKTISMFMDKPFKQADFEFLANKESYLAVGKWMEGTPVHSLEYEGMQKVRTLIKDTWLNGTSRLTVKTSIDGLGVFQPNAIRYTKPVVILIDEMAGSGGDMFPSMMQGLGRAKLFGRQTSGLGGHVQMYPAPLPNSQLRYSMTKSLFYRPDGVAIENNGAVPDKEYVITRNDVLYGFKEYQRAYLDYLSSLLP